MKKFLSFVLAMLMVLSAASVLTFSVAAEEATEPEAVTGTPTLSIDYANLQLTANVKILYAVYAENIDIKTTGIKLLVWDTAPESYTDGSQKYTIESSTSTTAIEAGKEHVIFEFADLGAINMVDYYYAVAYAVVNGTPVYSAPLKYSVLEYAYTILGKNGGEAHENANLLAAVNALLNYGAAMQVYKNHNTTKLANGAFSYINTENSVMADGFDYGICGLGENVSVKAVVPEGKIVHHWEFSNGEDIYTTDTTISVKAPTTEGEVATVTSVSLKATGKGDFIYELDATPDGVLNENNDPIVIDGDFDTMYNNGIYLPSTYYRKSTGTVGSDSNPDGTTFDVYMVADTKNIYVYYHFNKKTEIFYKASYKSPWHEDNVDFCFNANAGDSIGAEFHILGGVEGGADKAVVNNKPGFLTDYYVKHDDDGKGYSVEFAIPLSEVKGKDGNGNKMFSFTALGTLAYEWSETEPKRTYTTAYKAVWAGSGDGKASPSYVVLDETMDPVTTPTREDKNGNFVYELTKNTAANMVVDGLRESTYTDNGVHQVSVANFSAKKTTFDVYYTVDETHIYVLYEFQKREPIYYDSKYADKFHEDCADFVLDLAGTGLKDGKEFRILAGVEGGPGTAVTDDTLSKFGVDNYYVKHTYNGYNVEFSIPLKNVTGRDADDNRMISFTACSTVTTGWTEDGTTMTRVYTTGTSASGKGGDEAKATPNYLVVKKQNEYIINETTETIEQDGYKDSAYDSGLYFKSVYNVPDSDNNFEFYMTADKDYVYGLYIVKDTTFISNAATTDQHYWNDCIDFCYNLTGVTSATTAGNNFPGIKEFRIWAEAEGTNHYSKTSGHISPAGSNTAYNDLGNVDSYTLVYTDVGYNVEFKIARSRFNDRNVFGFVAMATAASSTTDRIYPCIENGALSGGNPAKHYLNKAIIVPAE